MGTFTYTSKDQNIPLGVINFKVGKPNRSRDRQTDRAMRIVNLVNKEMYEVQPKKQKGSNDRVNPFPVRLTISAVQVERLEKQELS